MKFDYSQFISHFFLIFVIGTDNIINGLNIVSAKMYTWFCVPDRSSMGTMLLIYFTLSTGKLDADGNTLD